MERYINAKATLGRLISRMGHPILGGLIAINVAVYLFNLILWGLAYLLRIPADQILFKLLAVPAYIPTLGLSPWTLFTYMFFHQEMMHILFNMLWLLAFGQIFLAAQPAYRLRNLYVLGGLAGAALYILAYSMVPYFHPVLPYARALGASAAVMAITIAATIHRPNMPVLLYGLFPVKVKWIALAAIAIDLLSVTGGNAGGHIAHLGGAVMGWLYARSLMRGAYFDRPFTWIETQWQRLMNARETKTKKQHEPSKKRMDAILRKLSRGGYASLTTEEKELLFRRRP